MNQPLFARSSLPSYRLRPNPTSEAKERAATWLRDFLDGATPFAFTYDGVPSDEFIGEWQRTLDRTELDDGRTRDVATYRDPATGLEVRCEVTSIPDSAAVEWVVYLRNGGPIDTPILEAIQAAQTRFERGPEGEFTLHRCRGTQAKRTDYGPIFEEPTLMDDQSIVTGETLRPKKRIEFATSGGRSSNAHFPFFNLEWPGGGAIVAIGWSGQWATSLTRDESNGLVLRAGQEHTHLLLHPGEEIRTPRTLLMFWSGALIDGHNQFRRLILNYYSPKLDGEPIRPPIATSCFFLYRTPESEGIGITEENQIEYVQRFLDLGLQIEDYWFDAGWHDNPGHWWRGAGSWYADPRRFPRGLRPVADFVHGLGMRFVVWFELERVYKGTMIDREHGDWVLRLPDNPNGVFNLGDPEARRWLTDYMVDYMTREGIDFYRVDLNLEPLPYWQANDAPDRQGMTEIRHIEGLYAFWDELRRRMPRLIIDNNSSGCRRMDLETVARSVPLWRSDYFFEPTGMQAQGWAINHYVPISCSGPIRVDPYSFRSAMSNGIALGWERLWDVRDPEFPLEQARRDLEEQKRLRAFFYGDYYPLTAYSVTTDTWLAYQFDRPDLESGFLLAFRRDESPYPTCRVQPGGIVADAEYTLRFEDSGEVRNMFGRDLAAGLDLHLEQQRESLLITYERTGGTR